MEDELPDIPCEPPLPAEIGDVWFCPECARKFYYVMFSLDDGHTEVEAWYTSEIG